MITELLMYLDLINHIFLKINTSNTQYKNKHLKRHSTSFINASLASFPSICAFFTFFMTTFSLVTKWVDVKILPKDPRDKYTRSPNSFAGSEAKWFVATAFCNQVFRLVIAKKMSEIKRKIDKLKKKEGLSNVPIPIVGYLPMDNRSSDDLACFWNSIHTNTILTVYPSRSRLRLFGSTYGCPK